MWRFYVAVAAVWVALSPPLFTGGACTAEFDALHAELMDSGLLRRTAKDAVEHFRGLGVPVSEITPERCREQKPRFLSRCTNETLVYARVPVRQLVCRTYRDADIKVAMVYDERGRGVRLNMDMAPFKSLPIPGTGIVIDWGR